MNAKDIALMKKLGGGGGGLPSGGTPYQQLVTDGTGTAKWEDRLAYDDSKVVIDAGGGTQFVKAADEIPSWASIDSPIKYWLSNRTNATGNPGDYLDLGGGSFGISGVAVFITVDGFDFNGIVFQKKGVYFIKTPKFYTTSIASADSDTPEITWDGSLGTIKTIDPKYIPSELNEIILPSSTSGSTKQFRITVDDTGTISAAEVT